MSQGQRFDPIPADPVGTVPTPALVIDLDALDRNIARMAAFVASHGRRLRPHAKTHKSIAIAQRQVAAGAVGVCVQKTSEAIALAGPEKGIDDIYVSNQVIDPRRLEALARLAAHRHVAVAVDSVQGAERLAAASAMHGTRVGAYVEVDVGHGRCGVPPAAAGALARALADRGVPVEGLQAYHGRAQHLRSRTEREAAVQAAAHAVAEARASLAAAEVPCGRVTGGGTGTLAIDAASGVWDELQAGSYVFMDRDYADNDPDPDAPRFEHALFVRAQVVSRASGHAVIDAGHKAYALDSGSPAVWRRPLDVANGGDEHGLLVLQPGADPSALPTLGECVWLVPGHCDPTVNLHDAYVVVRGGLDHGQVEAMWPVDARGALR
jgi:D-serine deaminase-like pyridoxal phosphate-dependent protein